MAAPWRSAATSAARTLARWRTHFSWLPQRPHLFNATLAENLRLGVPGAGDDELRAVLDAVGLSELVAGLPAGLETALGHDGLTMSAGERQRVALARALLRPAPVLLLDEPTASLDPPTVTRLAPAIEPVGGRPHGGGGRPRARPVLTLRRGRHAQCRPRAGGAVVSRPRGSLRRALAEPGTPYARLAGAGLLGLASAAATIGLLAGSGYVVGRAALRPGLGAIVGILAAVEVLAFLRGPLRYAERLVGHDAALARAHPLARVALRPALAAGARRARRLAQRRPPGAGDRRRGRTAGPLPPHPVAGRHRRGRGGDRHGCGRCHPAVGRGGARGAARRGLRRAGAAHVAAQRRRRDRRALRRALGPGGRRARGRARALGVRGGRRRPGAHRGHGGADRRARAASRAGGGRVGTWSSRYVSPSR